MFPDVMAGLPGQTSTEVADPASSFSAPPAMPMPGSADIPMDAKTVRQWKSRIDRAKRRRKDLEGIWQRLLEEYMGRPNGKDPEPNTVSTNKAFSQVELKKAQLFFDTPTVVLTPKEPLAQGLENAVVVHETILNHALGRNGVNAKRVIDKATFDVLATAGIGVTKLGYQPYTKDVELPDQPGAILNLKPQTISYPVYEEFFWSWVSPKKVLIPEDFRDTDFDQAPWIGIEFTKPLTMAKREYALPDDFAGKVTRDDQVFHSELSSTGGVEGFSDLVHGYEIWYKPAFFDDSEVHPLVQRRLVIIDGLEDRSGKHTASPYQDLDPAGRLTPDSMIGYPIHILTVRDLSDSSYPLSDSAMTERLTWELNKFRTQMVKLRDAAVPFALYDEGALPPETIEKIEQGEIGSLIGVEEGKLAGGIERIMAIPQRPELGRENYTAQGTIERDLDQTLGLGANQRGLETETERTATELTMVAQGANVRLTAERNRVIDWFLQGVAKFDTLLQRFGPLTPQPLQILGPNGVQMWTQWDKQKIAGRFLYDVKPDSGVHVDEAVDRKQALDTINFLAKDPTINRIALYRWALPKLHLNPNDVINPPQPPKPEPPNVSYRFGGADLANPLAVALMLKTDIPITAQDIQAAQQLIQSAGNPSIVPPQETPRGLEAAYLAAGHPPVQPAHPGMQDKLGPLSQHSADLTGGMQGIGGGNA